MPNRPKGKNKTWIAPVEKKTNSADKWGNDTNWYNKKEWKRLRNYYINKQPLCEICKRFGKIVEACVINSYPFKAIILLFKMVNHLFYYSPDSSHLVFDKQELSLLQ